MIIEELFEHIYELTHAKNLEFYKTSTVIGYHKRGQRQFSAINYGDQIHLWIDEGGYYYIIDLNDPNLFAIIQHAIDITGDEYVI